MHLCTKFQRNVAIGGGVVAISKMSNVGAVRHLVFDRSGFSQKTASGDTYCISVSNFNKRAIDG